MATFTWYYYGSTGPAWTDISTNKLVFSSSLTDLATNVTVGQWQDGTHIGSGDPGTDQCGANHANNVKWISSTQFDLNGGGTETLNDTNLVANECTIRINFADAASVALSSIRLYCYDGTTVTTEGVGVEMQAHVNGDGDTAWTEINDDSANVGGDNSGERLDVTDRSTPATSHDFYFAISWSPESVGGKSSVDLGFALIYT